MSNMKLISIPKESYDEYKYEVIFDAYKWDPQVDDSNTVSKYVLVIDEELAKTLEEYAQQLSKETIELEEYLVKNPKAAKDLYLPRKINKALNRVKNYDKNNHVRLMRFDFHPTYEGWAVSEVNSDVPGGLAEAELLPRIANQYFTDYQPRKNIAKILYESFKDKINDNSNVAFVYATSYSDDRQVMQYLSDYFTDQNMNNVFLAPEQIKFKNGRAQSILKGYEQDIDAIIRFFPLEWLTNHNKHRFIGYYDTIVPSCNHPMSIFAQSKRLPLIWDKIDVDVSTWKKLLPETKDPRDVKELGNEWILKPALGRVGEGISIQEVISKKEFEKIKSYAHKKPKQWVVQKKFISKPIITENNETFHLCIGVFTVNGKSAGFYGRISPYPRIDSNALEIPILVSKEVKKDV